MPECRYIANHFLRAAPRYESHSRRGMQKCHCEGTTSLVFLVYYSVAVHDRTSIRRSRVPRVPLNPPSRFRSSRWMDGNYVRNAISWPAFLRHALPALLRSLISSDCHFFFCARAKNAISHEFLRDAENVAEREKRISPETPRRIIFPLRNKCLHLKDVREK